MTSRAGLAALLAPLVLMGSARTCAAESPARSGFEWWRLRPADVTTTGSTVAVRRERPDAEDAPGATPGERRPVRVVYPGLISAR